MSPALPFLASLALSLPGPGQQTADTIVSAARSASGSSMQLELFVAPDREILTCRMLFVEPADAAVERVCRRLVGKDIDQGGRDADGRPIHAVARFIFTLDDVVRLSPVPELRVEAPDLPENASKRTLGIAVLVDRDGAITSCPELSPETRMLAELTCARLKGSQRGQRLGRNREPVAYLDMALVEFVVSSASAP